MELPLTAEERAELEAACRSERRVRVWRRYRAVLWLADGDVPQAIAERLSCSVSSVYGWVARWRQGGVAGLREGDHGGGRPRLDAAGEAWLEDLLVTDPQARGHRATGWTVPLLTGELCAAGYRVSEHTVRRVLKRRGWRWKRPRYLLGRPDPAAADKKRGWSSGPT